VRREVNKVLGEDILGGEAWGGGGWVSGSHRKNFVNIRGLCLGNLESVRQWGRAGLKSEGGLGKGEAWGAERP